MSSRLPISAAASEPGRAHADSHAWLSALRSTGTERDGAVARLHELLLRAARFEVLRRRAALSHVRGEELDDLALQAANDALNRIPGMRAHLEGCPACHEDYDSLRELVQDESNS